MTEITLRKDRGIELIVEGHAEFSDGDDIVCAAVSAITYALVYTFQSICSDIDISDGFVSIKCSDFNDFIEGAISVAQYGYEALCENYPENVSFALIN